ncbi:hypothetical protein V499_09092 [Pseudogymnoascus sp. VKM F-103]|nr:hypothetical protein V499_09092 [Pseudogymnoascus sp. VKM F-103]
MALAPALLQGTVDARTAQQSYPLYACTAIFSPTPLQTPPETVQTPPQEHRKACLNRPDPGQVELPIQLATAPLQAQSFQLYYKCVPQRRSAVPQFRRIRLKPLWTSGMLRPLFSTLAPPVPRAVVSSCPVVVPSSQTPVEMRMHDAPPSKK